MSEPLTYQRYWDNEEYVGGLVDEITAVLDDLIGPGRRPIADAIVSKVFKQVKLHTWCGLEGCVLGSDPDCRQTHYTFQIQTHPREFAYHREDDR